jgi:zinc finger FYVE domain-containing protein 26
VLPPSHKAAWEALAGVPEERAPTGLTALEGYERPAPMTITEEWVLTGDPTKDDGVRKSHRYESAPSSILFKVQLHKLLPFHLTFGFSSSDFLGPCF